MCYYVCMNKETFKIYRNGKLDLKDAINRELRFRAKLVGEVAVEVAQCVVQSFEPNK